MKVIAVPLARCMWVVDFNKVNPKGRSLLGAFQGIGKRYRFSKTPAHLMDYNVNNALEFAAGTFKRGNLDLRVGLLIFSDGLAADCFSSTDDSEAFLEDLREWIAKEYNLPIDDDAIIRKAYLSQLDVKIEKPFILNPVLETIAKKLSAECLTIDGKEREFVVGGFRLWSDDVGKQNAPQPFFFERKWGKPITDNIYFSQAQLTTRQHTELLEELERKSV